IILTRETALRFFGTENAVGKEIKVNDEFGFLVTGVAEDPPVLSTLQFDWLIPYDFLPDLNIDISMFEGTRTYNVFLMKDGTDVEEINSILPEQIQTWFEPDIETLPFLMAFSKIHLKGESQNDDALLIFIILAILILLVACINYMNLSTARFTGRAKEVGIRKTLGAFRGQLARQFIGESVFMAFIATDIALLIIELVIPWLELPSGHTFVIPYTDPVFIVICLGLIVVTGLVSGSYPSLVLSSFQPIKVLKNPAFHGFRGFRLRKALVVFQFMVSVIFLLGSIFVYQQSELLKNADKGFREDGIVYFATKGELWEEYPQFKNEVHSLPGVENVTTSHGNPSYISLGEFEWGITDESQKTIAHVCWAGSDFPEVFDIGMAEGEFYDKDYSCDRDNGIVINKRLVDYLGLENPIGHPFYLYHHRYSIIGVIDDFEFFPFTLSDRGLIMPFEKVSNFIWISLTPDNREGTIAHVEKIYKKYNHAYPFDYHLLRAYKMPFEEAAFSSMPLLWGITILGIFISCLGLFGLAAYTASQKTVEIGIRKTFGADTGVIIRKMSFNFAKPVMLGIILGMPLTWIILKKILSLFVNQVQMNLWIFAGVAVGVLLLSLVTVYWQSYMAARRKPVDSLRYE
nr:ABC transporter permease [Bacteroidota bacterium]